MNARVFVLALATLSLEAQPPVVTGIVEGVNGNEIRLWTAARAVAVAIDDKTVIRSGGRAHDAPQAGERIRVYCTRDAADECTATEIQTRTEFAGEIVRMDPFRAFEIVSPESGRSGLVYTSPRTDFGLSPQELGEGDRVLAVGWDLGNGRIEATQITVYNRDVPVTIERK